MTCKPWNQKEADALVGALSPIVGVFKFGVILGQDQVPGAGAPDTLNLIFNFNGAGVPTPDNYVDLILWLRGVWGKPMETHKTLFNPFTYRAAGPAAPEVVRRAPTPVGRRVPGDAGLRAFRAAAVDAPAIARYVENPEPEREQLFDHDPPRAPVPPGVNGVDRMLWEQLQAQQGIAEGAGRYAEAVPAKTSKAKKDAYAFKFSWLRNDGGLIYTIIM